MLAKLSVARNKYTFVSENESQVNLQLATQPCEICGIIVTAGNSACTFRIVDSTNVSAGYSLSDGFSVAAEASNSYAVPISHPIPMKKGMAIVCEQGNGSNAECTIWYN